MAKSPFVTKQTQTYKYPEPISPEEEDRLSESNPEFERRIDPEEVDEGHWITIRIPRSRADVDAVADCTQSMVVLGDNGDGAKFEQRIAHGNRGIFELLAEAWSFDAECNGANYARLDSWSGDWISMALGDAVRQGTQRDYAKKTKASSPTPKSSETKPLEPEPVE